MKKTAILVMTVIMLICITGCGAKRDPKYIGKWEAENMTLNGETTDKFVGIPIGALFRFEISDNGSVLWQSAVDNKIIQNANTGKEIKWKEKEENILLFTVKDLNGNDPDETMNLYYSDGKLSIIEGGSSINLIKVEKFTEIDPEALNSAASVIQNFGITQ